MSAKKRVSRAAEMLNDKFTPAALPDIYAPRHNLIATLQRASENRFVYICAPSGSGKTVSALLWLKASARKSVWIGLDRYDNSPAVFFKLLSTGLYSLSPENDNMLSILTSPSFSSAPVEHTVQLLSELYAGKESCALVLDDMHLVENGEILKSLPAVLRRLPRSFVVLIISRAAIPGELQGLFRDEALSLITQEQLRFTEEEILQYFNSLNRSLTPEESGFVLGITEGWAIGVNAVAKSGILEESGRLGFSRYFESNIWRLWEPHIREFCLKTSVVDEFNSDLAQLLTGERASLAIMQELSRTNNFLSNLHGDTYRYHHLFLDFLRDQANKNGLNTGELYKVAARYYKAEGDYSRALRFWALSGDFKGISSFLYLFLFENNRGCIAEYADFLAAFFSVDFPESAFRQFPPLHIAAAWYHYLTSHRQEFEKHMDAVYRNLPSIALSHSKFVEYAILAYSVDYRTSILDKIKNFGKMGRYVRRFTAEGLATNIASFTHNLPYFHRSNLDYSDLVLDPHSLEGVSKTFAMLLGAEWNYLKYHVRACFSYEQNDLEAALLLNSQALQILSDESKIEGRLCVYVLQASILSRMERLPESDAILDELGELANTSAEFFGPNLAALTVRWQLWNGDRSAAREWLSRYYVVETSHVELYRIYQHFSTARAYLTLGQTDEAMKYIRMLLQYGQDFNRPLDEAEACVLQAALEWALGQKKEAVSTMEAALSILQPYSFIRVVADEGEAVLPILKRIQSKLSRQKRKCGAAAVPFKSESDDNQESDASGSAASCELRTAGDSSDPWASEADRSNGEELSLAYVSEITLAAYRFSKLRKGVTANIQHNDKPVKLSRQQRSMVELLAQGYRGTAIAELTGLSISTVKSHLSAVYHKLDVNNAMDAVIRARELGLIE